ncbi:MAG: hypothetical protein SFW09_12360 [Hyphomicrobiaceae bacterium]|nr:hypothetical protein [Hyphomicrobiaceae bacterium]
MRMIVTAGVLCAALLVAVTAAVHAKTSSDPCNVLPQQERIVGE